MPERKKLFLSDCVVLQCLAEILSTFIINFIETEIELFECLYEIEPMSISEMKILIQSHCIALQSLAKILCTFICDSIVPKIKFCDCLHGMSRINTITVKDPFHLTLLFCNS